MPHSYTSNKIQEALSTTDNNIKDAVKLLITWSVRDQALLLGLTKPHLKDILTDQVNEVVRASRKRAGSGSSTKEARESAIVFPKARGDKRSAAKVPPPKSSERQASVMHQLVAAFKAKK